jgi:hypothetical protein
LGFLKFIAKIAVKLDKKSPINCINQHSKTLSYSFTHKSKKTSLKEFLTLLELQPRDFKPFLATVFMYIGDL